MHCEQIEALLAKLVFDEMDAPAKAEVLAHLSGCKACRDQYVDLRAAALLLKEGIEAGPAPVLSAERKLALKRHDAKIAKEVAKEVVGSSPVSTRKAHAASSPVSRPARRRKTVPRFPRILAISGIAAAILLASMTLIVSLMSAGGKAPVFVERYQVGLAARTAESKEASADGPAPAEHDLMIPDLHRGAAYSLSADGPAPAAAPPASDRVRARLNAESGVDKAAQDRGALARGDEYARGPGATTSPARPSAAPAKAAESFGWKSAPRDAETARDNRDEMLSKQSKDDVWKGGFGYEYGQKKSESDAYKNYNFTQHAGTTSLWTKPAYPADSKGSPIPERPLNAPSTPPPPPAKPATVAAPPPDPSVFFQQAKESDHNESADGKDNTYTRGEGSGMRERQAGQAPGVIDSIGVGSGGGGSGQWGGRFAYGNKLKDAAKTPTPPPATPPVVSPAPAPPETSLTARAAGDERLYSYRGARPAAGAVAGKQARTESNLGVDKAGNRPAEPQSKSRTSPGPAGNREQAEMLSRRKAEEEARESLEWKAGKAQDPGAEAAARADAEYRAKEEKKESLAAKVDALKNVEDGRRNENAESQIRAGAVILAVPEPASPAPDGYARAAGRELAQHERLANALDQLKADTKGEERAKAPASGKKEKLELHDIRDLAPAARDFPGTTVSGGLAGATFTLEDKDEKPTGREIVDLIKKNVRPGAWDDNGITATPTGQVIVRGDATLQKEVKQYLGKLRERTAEPPPFVRLKPEDTEPARKPAAPDMQRTLTEDEELPPAEGRKAAQQMQQQAEPDESLPSASFFKAGPVNPWVLASRDRFSTFALAVDTASYTLARRFFRKGFLPPAASVRMEEFVNAFDYNYPGQTADVFAIHAEGAPSPFRPNLTLLKVGVKGKVLGREGRKPAHLVFVIDGSGSMARPDRLPLIQYALRGLAGQLGPADRVSVVVFGTEARLAAEAVPAARRDEVLAAIDSVQPAGPTNLLLGLQLGYAVAQRQFRAGEINRVILCTDGVANIGASDGDEMLANIKAYRDQGVTFTAAGFGTGNYNDALLARLAAQGDGRYVFIDSAAEARRVFVEELAATLQSIAVDAKIQVEFDPARVRRYRLIGYEARAIRDEDFRNDAIEAAEVGSGQSATALYEVELMDDAWMNRQGAEGAKDDARRMAGCIPVDALGTVFVRYRNADTGKIEEIAKRVEAGSVRRRTVEDSPRFFLAAAVAEFAELLRESEYAQGSDTAKAAAVLERVSQLLPLDGKVKEIAEMAARAKGLSRAQ